MISRFLLKGDSIVKSLSLVKTICANDRKKERLDKLSLLYSKRTRSGEICLISRKQRKRILCFYVYRNVSLSALYAFNMWFSNRKTHRKEILWVIFSERGVFRNAHFLTWNEISKTSVCWNSFAFWYVWNGFMFRYFLKIIPPVVYCVSNFDRIKLQKMSWNNKRPTKQVYNFMLHVLIKIFVKFPRNSIYFIKFEKISNSYKSIRMQFRWR